MISTHKTCHFWSLFSPFLPQKPPKTSKNASFSVTKWPISRPQMGHFPPPTGSFPAPQKPPPNVAKPAAPCAERFRLSATSTPWNSHLHTTELPPPCHGTTTSIPWRQRSSATFLPLSNHPFPPSPPPHFSAFRQFFVKKPSKR